jgi:hypothetical protein
MADSKHSGPVVDDSTLLLIVVGAHLRAEMADRPLAYKLQHMIEQWLGEHADSLNVPIQVVVCTDIWYLNNASLQRRPTICIGGPGVNALSAYFAQQLPAAGTRDQQVVIQIDPEFTDLRVCLWGSNHKLTIEGLDLFISQYFDGYLRAVATQVEPKVD